MSKKENNEIQLFINEEFGEIRTVTIDENPWFVAKDVCDILDVGNPSQSLSRLEDDEKNTIILNEGIGNPSKTIINESGFYTLVLSSRKPIAKPFRLWVTREVLPQIRKTGGYIPIVEDEPNEVFLARAVKIANDTIEKKDEIIEMQKKRISSLEETEKDWKLLMNIKGTFCINDIAHFIGIGEYKLFALLRNFKVLFLNNNGDNVPYENQQNKKYMTTVAAIAPDGTAHSQTRVYPDGIAYITKILRKNGILEVSA